MTPKTHERLDPEALCLEASLHRKLFDDHMLRYRYALTFVRGKKVLDVACGTGYGSALLKTEGGAAEVVGVDVSSEAISKADKQYQIEGLRYLVLDVEKEPLPEPFYDVATSFETIEHLKDPDLFLNKIYGALCPKGLLIVSAPIRITTDMNKYHLHDFTERSFCNLLTNAGFRILETKVNPLIFTLRDMIEESSIGGYESPVVDNPFLFYLKQPQKFFYRFFQLITKGGMDITSMIVRAEKLS